MKVIRSLLVATVPFAVACAPVAPPASDAGRMGIDKTGGAVSGSISGSMSGSVSGPMSSAAAIQTGGSESKVGQTGILLVRVEWPRRVQVMPYSANLVTVLVTDTAGDTLGQASLSQGTGTTSSQAQLRVPSGRGISVLARAFQNGTLVAEAEATSSVKPNQRVPVALHLAPKFAPTIATFQPNGGAGSYISIAGTNFGAGRNVPVSGTFGGVPFPNIFRQDDAHLQAEIPAGVTSGGLVIVADGVPSATASGFVVLTELSAIAPVAPTTTVGSTVNFSVQATGSSGAVAAPYLTWRLLPASGQLETTASGSFSPATGSVTAFKAIATGSARIQAGSGNLVSSTTLIIQ